LAQTSQNILFIGVTLLCKRMRYRVQSLITSSTSLSKYSLRELRRPLIEGTIFGNTFCWGKERVGKMLSSKELRHAACLDIRHMERTVVILSTYHPEPLSF
jgi:hypothetical protein